MRKLFTLLAALCLLWGEVAAQNRTVTGKVTDENGLPLSYATVVAKGTKIGTTTNSQGNFTLSVPTSATRLVISYVGRADKEIALTSEASYSVMMDASSVIDEVVVTGVGAATSKRKVAISVESVSAKDLSKVPQATIDQALVGKIAGAQINSISGQPGQQAAILLRGINTLGSTQPMILVDGVQINTTNNSNGSASNLSSRLSDLDLSTVERVEVIQGSAAATIYGAQGANGVIQIFTKKGQRNSKPSISFNSRVAFDEVLTGNLEYAKNHFYETDAQGFIISNTNVRLAPNASTGIYPLPKQPTSLLNAQNNKPFAEQTFNHLDYLFRTAQTWNHSLNVSGGGERNDYSLTLSRLNQQSVFMGDYKRTNVSLNLGLELFKNFTVRSTTQLVYSDNGTGGISGQNNINSPLGTGLNTRQFLDLRRKDAIGNYIVNPMQGETSVNPFYSQQFREWNAKNTRIMQNANLNYKPFRWLEVDYKFGLDNYRYDFTNLIKYQLNTLTNTNGIAPTNGSVTYDRDNQTFTNSLLTLFLRSDFQRDFKINLPITSTTHLAYDYRKDKYNNLITSGTGFTPFPPATINGTTYSNSETNTDRITFGYLVNQKFDWGNLFGVSGGVRVDYSSAFGSGSDAFVFPRADAYVRLSELIKSPVLTEFKLRAAYGQAGIQPGAYDRFITLNAGNVGTGGSLYTKFTSNNPLLNVEVSTEVEVGTDIAFKLGKGSSFQNVRLSATYWNKKSEDVIRAIEVAPSTGAGGLLTNAISLEASGIQASLDADVIRNRNFTWDFGIRFGSSKSIVAKTAGGKDIVVGSSGAGQFALREGYSVGAFFGTRPLRNVDEQTSKGARYIPAADVANYEVVNGMVVNKNTKQVQFTTEQEPIGDPNPKFNMTFLNNFSYKNLTVSVQVDWVYGNDIYNQTRQWMYRDFLHSDFDQSITINGQTGPWVAYYSSLYKTNSPNGYFVEKGSFMRLRDLTLSYQFGSIVNKQVKFVKSAEVSVSGRNLFTISNYSGLDPESSASLNNPLRRGLDLYNFPNFRTYQVGINLGF